MIHGLHCGALNLELATEQGSTVLERRHHAGVTIKQN